jgi:hypothetical protein
MSIGVEQYKIEVPGFLNPSDVVDMLRNKHFSTVIMACWKIYNFKGNDYTRGKGDLDRTDNFKMAGENTGVTALQAWGVYFYKHVSAIWRFMKDGKVESEPIEGRIYDVINYAILLVLLVKEMKGESDA